MYSLRNYNSRLSHMSKRRISSTNMVATRNKNKVIIPCSTPEQAESPSRDSDSCCGSEAASPVPFLCTQDGAEGETDVIWNFYTPKSENATNSKFKNSTPLSRKNKRSTKHKLIERQLPKRRPVKTSQKKTELYQELFELNKNLPELIAKNSKPDCTPENTKSRNDEDIFFNSPECSKDSPKSGLKTTTRCLRRNVLSSKFSKPETEIALDSDDSMNECLLKASQAVENIVDCKPTAPKRMCYENSKPNVNNKPDFSFKSTEDSIDAILNTIKIESPLVSKVKKCDSPHLNNDSFDSLVGNLNDSALDQLTQMPIKNEPRTNISKEGSDWKIQELIMHDGSPKSSVFGRHNSMPESPSVSDVNKPPTSEMVFGRYNSMPYKSARTSVPGDSPIRCSPDQIERKRQQAREKLIAKRLLPFTCSQNNSQSVSSQLTRQPPVKRLHVQPMQNDPATSLCVQANQHPPPNSHLQAPKQAPLKNLHVQPSVTNICIQASQHTAKKSQFQPRVPSNAAYKISNLCPTIADTRTCEQKSNQNSMDLKLMIEKKRQEALMKLRRRQPHTK